MKTFEERYTAWLDRQLHGDELHAFERELAESHPDAFADRDEAHALSGMLRRYGAAPALTGGEFFNTQLQERIARDERQAERAPARPWFSFPWALPHLAWASACCLLLSFTIYRTWVVPSQQAQPGLAAGVAAPAGLEISAVKYDDSQMKAEAGAPDIYATPVHSKKDGVTVLWIDGLDYLPATYNLQ